MSKLEQQQKEVIIQKEDPSNAKNIIDEVNNDKLPSENT